MYETYNVSWLPNRDHILSIYFKALTVEVFIKGEYKLKDGAGYKPQCDNALVCIELNPGETPAYQNYKLSSHAQNVFSNSCIGC